jgi:P-type Cu2+ transporter
MGMLLKTNNASSASTSTGLARGRADPPKILRASKVSPSAAQCRHCGVPTTSSDEEFCCAGCAYVYRIIHEEGLEAYYQIKDKVTSPADAALLPARDYEWLIASQRLSESRAGTATPELRLDVQGISCAGCVWLIERIFNKQPFSGRIDVNAQTGQVRMSWQLGFDAAAFARTLQGFNYLLSPASAARSVVPESRRLVKRIGLCGAFAMNVMLYTLPSYFGMEAGFTYARLFETLSLLFGTLSFLAGGGYFLNRGFRSLRAGAMNIDLPIALGILGAYIGSCAGWVVRDESYMYFDFVSTFILLMLIGRWAQLAAVERNQRRLLAQQPTPPRVRVWNAAGVPSECAPEELAEGQVFATAPGHTVPVEGRLVDDEASMGLAWINGESAPRTYRKGQRIPSGAVNLTRKELRLQATQAWKHSLLAELMKPVERGEYRNRLLDRVVQGYLITIISVAILAGAGWWWATGDLLRSGSVVTAILVVSCPCAIGLSFPLADEMATVLLRRRGVFVRIADLWHRLAKVKKLVFDKTGTLTLETPKLRNGDGVTSLSVLEQRALMTLVNDSGHPAARCLYEELLARGGIVPFATEIAEEIGHGVSTSIDGVEWRLGRPDWALRQDRSVGARDGETSHVEMLLTRAGQSVAFFEFEESARADAVEEVRSLKERRLEVYVLSGDRRHKVEKLARELGLPDEAICAEMSPQQKAEWVQTRAGDDALMLGDGANDSLAFDRALCRGTPVVHRGILAEKADFYYLGRGIEGIRALFEVDDARRRTHRALMVFSISYNLMAVGLAVTGHMDPLLAAILMPLSSLLSLGIVGVGMKRAWAKV